MSHHVTRLIRAAVVLAFAVGLALTAAACGDDDGGGDDRGATGTEITIKDFAFSPNPLRAKAGDTITVQNDDSTGHTFTADDGSVDTGSIDGGTSASVKLEKAGTLAYHCQIHTTMKGTVEVAA